MVHVNTIGSLNSANLIFFWTARHYFPTKRIYFRASVEKFFRIISGLIIVVGDVEVLLARIVISRQIGKECWL